MLHTAFLNSRRSNGDSDKYYSSAYLMDYEEVKEYCKLYLKDDRNSNDIANMDNLVSVAIERFNKIKDETKENEFKTYVIKFFRAYNFLIQIYPIKKTSLYEMYVYL